MSSSGLSRFLAPKLSTTPTDDRASRAAGAKVKSKDRKIKISASQTQYEEENGFGLDSHNGYPHPHAQHGLETTSGQDIFEDSTIASNFDETVSTQLDAPQFQNVYQGHQQENNYGSDDQGELYDDDETAHQNLNFDLQAKASAPSLNYKESQQFYKSDQPSKAPRQGRFNGPLTHRSASPVAAPVKVSRKRERTHERQYSHQPTNEQQYQQQHQQQEYGAQNVHLPPRSTGLNGYDDPNFQGHVPPTSEAGYEPNPSSQLGSPIHQPIPEDDEYDVDSKEQKIPAIPDYSDEELKKKRFADLKNEDWAVGMPKYQLPRDFDDDFKGPNVTVQQKMESFRKVRLTDDASVLKSDNEQEAFFEHLSDEDWEAAGEYIRAKTDEAMKNMQSTRQKKREITARYEKMYEDREKLIQKKALLIQSQLVQIQNQGMSIFQNMLPMPSPRPAGSSRSSSHA